MRTGSSRVLRASSAATTVFEQVLHAAAAIGEQLARVELLDILGQHQHWQARGLGTGLDRGLQALVGERRR